jgi:hypothetical protein
VPGRDDATIYDRSRPKSSPSRYSLTLGSPSLGGPRSVDDDFNAPLPGAVKIDADNLRQNVHHERRSAHAKKLFVLDEIGGCQSFKRCAEFREGGIDRSAVFGIRFNQQVNILGGARLRVKRYGIPANNQIFNFLVVEDGQEFLGPR